MLTKLQIDIAIPADRYVALYTGGVKNIFAISRDGFSVQFPGSVLNRFVTHEGVYGSFEMSFDRNNKLTGIKKLD